MNPLLMLPTEVDETDVSERFERFFRSRQRHRRGTLQKVKINKSFLERLFGPSLARMAPAERSKLNRILGGFLNVPTD